MSISGLVVHAHPDKLDSVRAAVSGLDGTEVHAETPDGRLVVTVDLADDRAASDTISALTGLDGVLNASLVYNWFEEGFRPEEETS